MVDLAQLLRDEIKARGLSQTRIARDIQEGGTPIEQATLSQFLNGADMRLKKASVLFDYLGLTVQGTTPKSKRQPKTHKQFTPKPKSG